MEDTRNVVDKYKSLPMDEIVRDLDAHGMSLEIAVENLSRDFNMGTIVRTANAFGVRHVHVVGRRQWNKRGAMMTDKYLHVHYYATIDEFIEAIGTKHLFAMDNVAGSEPLSKVKFPLDTELVFGSEGDVLSEEMQARAEKTIEIEQYGSTRSLNVGVAAGIVMYEWIRQQALL